MTGLRFALCSAALAVSVLFGCLRPAAAQQEVVFGTAGQFADSSAAVFLAIDRGWLREAGITARVVDFKGGAPAVQALVGNGITFCICAPEHAIRLRNRNVDGVIAFALDRRHTYALLATANSTARALSDLKDSRVGITSAGSLTENLLTLAFNQAGLQVGNDVELIGVGVGAAQKAALDSGRTAAGMFGNLDAIQLTRAGYRVVHDWRQQTVPSLALIGRQHWLEENSEVAGKLLQVLLRAQNALQDDRALAVATLQRVYPGLPASVLEQVAQELPDRLSRTGRYTQAEVQALEDSVIATDPGIRPVPYETIVPDRLLRTTP